MQYNKWIIFLLLSYHGGRARCIVTSYELMMSYGRSSKMVFTSLLTVKIWWWIGKLWPRLIGRFTGSIAEYMVFWWKPCLIQNTLRLLIDPLVKLSLNHCVPPMKETNKWKKPRLTSWFISMSFLEWRKMKISKPCSQGFKLLYMALWFWIKVMLFLTMSRRFLRVFLLGSDQRLQPFMKQRI